MTPAGALAALKAARTAAVEADLALRRAKAAERAALDAYCAIRTKAWLERARQERPLAPGEREHISEAEGCPYRRSVCYVSGRTAAGSLYIMTIEQGQGHIGTDGVPVVRREREQTRCVRRNTDEGRAWLARLETP